MKRHSLFSQSLDRGVFAAYFVGGIGPVAAFTWLVHQYVLPYHAPDDAARAAWVGVCVSLGVLSLGLFLALRVITQRAARRMRADNQRLEVMLAASRELAGDTHPEATLGRVAEHVGELIPDLSLGVLFSRDPDKVYELMNRSGALPESWWEQHLESVRDLAGEAVTSGEAAANGDQSWVALPIGAPTTGQGAVVLVAGSEALRPDALDAAATVVGMANAALRRGDLEDAQRNFFAHVTEMLVGALDAHVVEREGHALGVARLANRLGHAMGLSADRIERLHFAAMLHDIGLLKFEQTRHRDSRALRRHPTVGARMLARIRLWEPIAPIVQTHHEWWDGSGYPDGKAGEDIPLEGRIVALADAVDAMRRPKMSRAEPLTAEEIAREVEQGRGTQFDPTLVDAFLALHERDELGL
ncbi:MAG: HD domain-containing phosphohydrolase [Myxococcota bacterium]